MWVCPAHLHRPVSPPPRERHRVVFLVWGPLGSLVATGRAFRRELEEDARGDEGGFAGSAGS